MVNEGLTGSVLRGVTLGLDAALSPVLYSNAAIFLGILAVLQWHMLPMSMRSALIRVFGRNILVLQIYYDDTVHVLLPFIKDKPFAVSCWLVFSDNVLMWYLCRKLGGGGGWVADTVKQLLQDNFPNLDASDDQVTLEDDAPFKNVYMYLCRPFRRATLFFIAQVGLMLYYIYNLDTDPDTHDASKVSLVKWFFAVIITAIAGEDETGSDFSSSFWDRILLAESTRELWAQNDTMSKGHRVFFCIPMTYRCEWTMRCGMDWIVNSVCRAILMGTAPIMLCVEEPLDFIKDCLAVFFIAALDDFDDARSVDDFEKEAKFYRMPDVLVQQVKNKMAKTDPDNHTQEDSKAGPTQPLLSEAA